MQSLSEYIKQNYESKSEFARKMGVTRQQVNRWCSIGYMVNDSVIFKKMYDLNKIIK